MEQTKILKIFLASPSDVKEERQMMFTLKDELDHLIGKPNQIRFEFVNWERSAYPGVGDDAQDVINRNIGDDYDIFVGIFWQRFGSPTNRAESGTKEEFDRAYQKYLRAPNENHIMVYFKTAPPSDIYNIDLTQFQKVKEFKENIGSNKGILYWNFETTDELKRLFLMHLASLINDKYIPKHDSSPFNEIQVPTVDKYELLAQQIDSGDDSESIEGILELMEKAQDAMNSLPLVTTSLTSVMEQIGLKFGEKTKQINAINNIKDERLRVKKATEIVNKLAIDLDDYADQTNNLLPEFSSLMNIAIESYSKLIIVSSQSGLFVDEVDVQMTSVALPLYQSIDTSLGQIAGFLQTMNGLLTMTSKFGTAKRNAELATNVLFKQFIKSKKDLKQLMNSRNITIDEGDQES